MNEACHIIRDLGGVNNVIKLLNISKSAVYVWMENNKIPPNQAIRLYFICLESAIPMPLERLFHHVDCPAINQYKKDNSQS